MNRYKRIWKEIPKETKSIIDIGGRDKKLLREKPYHYEGEYSNFEIEDGNDITKKIKNPKKYDVIVLSHVIEHTANQEMLLQNINSMMHKNSILILLTPNSLCFRRMILRLLGKRMESYGGNETHLVAFNSEVLGNLLERYDFDVIKSRDRKIGEEIFIVAKKVER